MKDQKNAALLRKKALDQSIDLLKTLKEYSLLIENDKISPIKDAIDNAEITAVMVACEALQLEDVDKAEAYIQKQL